MAKDTSTALRQQVIYSVFVRNYSKAGTFAGLERDLDRIKALGVDLLWLMPIHPIGEKARKGADGSPYANRDYRSVNPAYGTREDFVRLVDAIHARGMRCMIDVVYNHTSPDSVLSGTHPEWFYHKPDGGFGNRVGDWTDIIDLDYSNRDLWAYQIETLKRWAELVDGFRCDVAPLIPLDFWKQAREAVAEVKPGCVWLAESVERGFIDYLQAQGLTAHTDAELYQAFDLTYDYDIFDSLQAYADGKGALGDYLAALNGQEQAYPENYVKLHFLENHDRKRARALFPDPERLRNWTAFLYFMKGTVLLYNGQEVGASQTPSLFDRDPIRWDFADETAQRLSALLPRLYRLRQDPLFQSGSFTAAEAGEGTVLARRTAGNERLIGVFGVSGRHGAVDLSALGVLPDGTYVNQIDGKAFSVRNNRLDFSGEPIIFKFAATGGAPSPAGL